MTAIYFVGVGADAVGVVVDFFAFFFFAFLFQAFAGTAGRRRGSVLAAGEAGVVP